MSRCFPYPPPGYALSSARKDALIDSIKLQKPKVQAKEQRKEKKRDKKEKKKDKSSLKNLGNSDVVHSHFSEKFWSDGIGDFSQKGSKAEIEQLERSGLTEEHAKPVFLPGPSSSSDSTENSNKRKRQPSPVDVRRGHGKIIRIRLTSKKQTQSDVPSVNEQKPCSTSSRIHAPCQINNDVSLRQRSADFCSTSGSTSQCLVLKSDGERIHVASNQNKNAPPFETKVLPAASKQIKNAPPLEIKAVPSADKVLTAMQKEGLRYQNLIENWVSPQMLQDVCVDNEDEDWLFGSKSKLERSEKKRVHRDDGIPCLNTLSLWPRAQYLPEVDLFALPYTVPF
ncbi:hypothetical protein SASPL_148366 [Salvia splendens]|uniref:Uncharacterized protein n=1 Tax=Salvia splendens TaxID=180675 RepID=A0A8X8Z415_SALSN|nr:uncharacterized protein LOC121779902 [Salvia splendens]KAG6390628.1 hypothetical protein SASPL_148366 [Salvia splendens]